MASISPSVIKDVVLEDVYLQFPIHPYLHKTINILQSSNLFLYYRTYRITAYVNPRNAVIVGGVLHSGAWLLGMSEYLKLAIYIKCALDLFEKYEHLYESCQAFNDAIRFKYPMYHPLEWEAGSALRSPSMRFWWKTTIRSYRRQTVKVMKCAWNVFIEIFKFGFYLRDLYLLVQNDPNIEFYGCSELADDLMNHATKLENSLCLLSEQLTSHEALGNRLMQKMGMKSDLSVLIQKIKRENSAFLDEAVKQVKGGKEDLRSFIETGNVDWRNDLEKSNRIAKSRFIPYWGQSEVERIFIDF